MKARRAAVLAALTVLVAALPSGPAYAAGTGQITSPAADTAVASGTPLVVEVTGWTGFFDPSDHTVQLRLTDVTGGQAWAGTEPVAATCQAGNCRGDSTWTAGTFDPASLAPFGTTASCNGAYGVQVRVDGGAWTGHGIRIARAPGAPSGVAVTPGVGEAEVTWDGAADPDVVGYRVERRASGGDWASVGQTSPSARALTDDDVNAGDVEYRVVTLKGDGLVNGAPAQPCTDPDADLATPSAAVPTTVRSASSASGDDPSPSPSASEGSGDSDGSDGSREGDGAGSDGDGAGSGDGAGDGDGGGDSGDARGDQTGVAGEETEGSSSGGDRPSAGSRVAPPTAVGTSTGPNVDVADPARPDSPQVAEDRETFYGDGMEFSEELDFSELGEVDALGDTTVERRIRVPGGLQSVLGEELDPERILAPLAAGLILLACALHLRRWTRDGADV